MRIIQLVNNVGKVTHLLTLYPPQLLNFVNSLIPSAILARRAKCVKSSESGGVSKYKIRK
jgi:DNA-binding transcriptional regulator YdaS (Cro superfamily)